MKKLLIGLAMLAGAFTAPALTVDSTVSDHCVLLQNAQNTVKGTTTAGKTVTVKLGGTQVGSATADSSGAYQVKFNPGTANATGRDLVVSDGSASKTISDVLVGEVWFVAGQSNAFNMMDGSVMTADYATAYPTWKEQFDCPNLRVVISTPTQSCGGVSDYYAAAPSQNLNWIVCRKSNEANVKKISPLAFFFGKKLSEQKNCPVGIVLVGKGGSPIGYHMTSECSALAKTYKGGDFSWGDGFSNGNNFSGCYTRTDTIAARGAVWAQGETDGKTGGDGYRHLLRAFVENWRSRRNQQDFPILIYGFANYDDEAEAEGERKWPRVRWEQEKAVADGLIPNAVVFHAIDLSGSTQQGYAKAIHPDQKEDLAARALLAARNLAYGETSVAYRCPYPTQAYFNSDRSKVYVTFPSSVTLTMNGIYTHIPFRIKNRNIEGWGASMNPTSVTIGADGHSLEVAIDNTALTLADGDNSNSIEYCNVAGTADKTWIYEQRVKDQNGFPMPPFALNISNTGTTIDTHTHTWGTPTYTWNSDNTICTGRATCTKDSSHTAVQAVNATLTVTTAATATTAGAGTRTATFASPFSTQTKNVTIPATGSSSGSGGSGSSDPVVPPSGSHAGVQLWANGPYWATMNVGATSETDAGKFYMWGDTTGYAASDANLPFYDSSKSTTYGKTVAQLQAAGITDASGNLNKAYDAAYLTMGGDWRLPTQAEWTAFTSNCTFSWDDSKKVLVATGKDAYASAKIYLPCPGYFNYNSQTGAISLGNQNFCSYYFSATASTSDTSKAQGVTVQKGGVYGGQSMSRYSGYCLRAVSSTNPGSGSGSGSGSETEEHTHSWGTATYTWSSDSKSCSASASCTVSGCSEKNTQQVTATYQVVTAATETTAGQGRWTAAFTSPFTAQTKNVVIPATGSGSSGSGSSASGNANGYEYVQLWKDGPGFAKTNVGGSSETSFGLMFSYGSTVGTKKGAVWAFDDGCPTAGKTIAELTSAGIIDAAGNLTAAYDAANVKMGGDWRMPTKAEMDALISNCDLEYVTENSVKGTRVTGRGDYASASIFIPCTGYYNAGGSWCNEQFYGVYLTATAEDANTKVYTFALQANVPLSAGKDNRANGYAIRAVLPGISGSGSGGSGSGDSGSETEEHTHSWGTATYTWSSDNKTCSASASCTVSGCTQKNTQQVTATYAVVTAATESTEGQGRWTATFTTPFTTQTKNVTIPVSGSGSESGSTTTFNANGYEYVQLWAGGPGFAKTNVGGSSETSFGLMFSYGSTVGTKKGAVWAFDDGCPTAGKTIAELTSAGIIDAAGNLTKAYDAANVKMGGDWRMPTKAELDALLSNCDLAYVTENSVKGTRVTGRGDYASASIFIPCTGYYNAGGTWCNEQVYGVYLTATAEDANSKVYTYALQANVPLAAGKDNRANGYAIRGVISGVTGSGSGDSGSGDSGSGDSGSTDTHTHVWGTATYTWSSDGKTCSASASCTVSGCTQKNTQQVTAVYSVVQTATDTAAGTGRYTATFTSPFTTQTKDTVIPATGSGSGSSGAAGTNGGHEGVQLWANGPYWSTMNCGATKIGQAGAYYAGPNDTKGSVVKNGALTGTLVENTTNTVWGGSWRKPTATDFQGLIDNTTYLGLEEIDGQPNIKLCGKDAPYTDKVIWIPIAGFGFSGKIQEAGGCWGTQSHYWGSTPNGSYMRNLRIIPSIYPSNSWLQMVDNHAIVGNVYTIRMCCDSVTAGDVHTHSWGTATYAWTQTATGYECTASVACTGDSSHVKTQTSTATYAVIQDSTETATGTGRYTATFSDTAFAAQTKDVTIAKKDPSAGGDSGETGPSDPVAKSANYYVSTTGSDSNNGTSRATAFATIAKAVEVATDGQSICVLKGTYNVVASGVSYADSAAIIIEKAITIFGETGNPADVVVHNTKAWSDSGNYNLCYRVFKLNNAGAVISGLTAENGISRGSMSSPKFFGSNIKIDTNGGVVTNCIVRNGRIDTIFMSGADPSTEGGGAIACLSQNGLIVDCVISNNFSSMGRTSPNQKNQKGGTAVLLTAGTIRNSLVAYNTVSESWTGSAIYAEEKDDATTLVENCTIAYNKYVNGGSYGNYADSGELYPIWVPLNSYDGKTRMPEIKNCLVYGNVTRGSSSLIVWNNYADSTYGNAKKAAAAAFVNCAIDMTAPSGMTAITVSASEMDANFMPKSGTAAYGKNIGWKAVTASSTPGTTVDWDHPVKTLAAGVKASEAWPTLAGSKLANAKASRLQSWAKNVGKVSFTDATKIREEAFLLNCADNDTAINAAKAAFKFDAVQPGTLPQASDFAAKDYNGTVRILGCTDLVTDTWGEAEEGDKFFRAELTLE